MGDRPRYESTHLGYRVPESKHKYTPDFELAPNVFIEVKGKLTLENRKTLLHIRQQHMDVKIYLLFGNSNNRLRKGSPTTYASWADKQGFEWDDIREVRKRGGLKKSWLKAKK